MSKIITTGMLSGVNIGGLTINISLPSHSGNYSRYGANRQVDYVVMHYTGNERDTARANANYFTGERGVSAHLFVDESSIYQSVDLRAQAWHCGGADKYFHTFCRNHNSIGIEMCCSGDYKVSAATKENAAQLCAYICQLIGVGADGVENYVLRHWDVSHKNCPAQMAGNGNQEWAAFKARVKQILKGEDDEMLSYEDFKKYMDRYTQEQAEKPASKWAEGHIQRAKEYGVMAGDAKGDFHPQSSLTRQEAAILAVGIMNKINERIKS